MKLAISLLLISPILIFFMFQPFMNEVVHDRGVILESTASKAAKLAAQDGYLSVRVINTVKQDLTDLHFQTALLTITGTSSQVTRGNPVTVTVQYPVGNLYIFINFFSTDGAGESYHYTFTEDSEFIR
jgi:hypothetical protein